MGKLSDSYLNKVVDSTDIVKTIGEYVPLRKTGTEYVGVCPFHKDGSPSMNVNSAKGVYFCRSCLATGNVIQFVERSQGIPFLEVVESLARAAGLPTPDEVRGKSPEASDRTRSLYSVLTRAQELYRHALGESKPAQDYLRGRGITPEMADAFGIGYAPPGRKFLVNNMKDVSASLLVDAGLAYESIYQKGRMIDLMEDRIIFPIRNASGKTVAFGGRSLGADKKAQKYMNTPETAVFKKGTELYGMFEAAREIQKTRHAVVSEGFVDVVVPHGHGVNNVVGAMGVALQAPTIQKLFRTADTIVYCFDGDAAGRTAAFRAMQLTAPFIDEKKRCRFAFLPPGMDPDDVVSKEGPDAFREYIAKSEPMSKYVMRELMARQEMDTVEGQAGFALEAMEVVEKITCPTIKGLMIQQIKKVIPEDVPLPLLTPKEDPKVENESQAVPPKSVFGRRSNSRPAPTPNAAVTIQPANLPPTGSSTAATPSLALRVLGLMMQEPLMADHFDAEWLTSVNSIPETEIKAVASVVDFIKNRDSDDLTSGEISRHFENSDIGEIIQSAIKSESGRIQCDAVQQMESFMNVLITLHQRKEQIKKMSRRP